MSFFDELDKMEKPACVCYSCRGVVPVSKVPFWIGRDGKSFAICLKCGESAIKNVFGKRYSLLTGSEVKHER